MRGSAAIAALLVAGLSMASMPVASETVRHGTSSRPISAVSIPRGWNSYAYGGVTISVPQRWAVKHNTNCANASAPGVLLLGFPKVAEHCPAYQYSGNYVAIYATTAATTTGAALKVNGLTVDVGFGSPAQLEWNIPALGLQAIAASPDGSRILQTLRHAGPGPHTVRSVLAEPQITYCTPITHLAFKSRPASFPARACKPLSSSTKTG
jgi:hypothetical protein